MLLKNEYKFMLLDILTTMNIDAEVWAYGSRVSGNAHDGSDLDIVIVPPDRKKIPIDVLINLKEQIRESNIPIIVELFDWARLPESFHENILANYEVLCQTNQNVLNDPKNDYKNQE